MADVTKLVTVYKVATANIRDVLFEGEVGNFYEGATIKIPLSNSYKEYDILGFYLRQRWGDGIRFIYREIPTEILNELINSNSSNNTVSFCWGYSNSGDFFDIQTSSTDNELTVILYTSLCTKIVGIKYVTVGTLIDDNNT